jgi:hypothetical protein
MPPRNDVPQTVGEALREQWTWLGVECQLCRRSARITFAGRSPDERLASMAARLRCTTCGDQSNLSYMSFTLGTAWLREKPISFLESDSFGLTRLGIPWGVEF